MLNPSVQVNTALTASAGRIRDTARRRGRARGRGGDILELAKRHAAAFERCI